jgi:Co/Zn/Cd efflux system component
MKGDADIGWAAVFLLAAFAIEVTGFFVSNSLCLMADSFFIFAEFLFFLMVFYRLKSKGACAFTLVSSLAVFLSGLFIIYLAVYRFVFGSVVAGIEVPVFALAGLAAGAYAIRKAGKLYNPKKTKDSLVHVLRKTVSSLLVISGGVWIAFTGEVFVDYLFGVLIGFAVMFEALLLFRDSSCLLLEGRKSETRLFKNVKQ